MLLVSLIGELRNTLCDMSRPPWHMGYFWDVILCLLIYCRLFSDVYWACISNSRRVNWGICYVLWWYLVAWSARKHATVPRSIIKSEYKELGNATGLQLNLFGFKLFLVNLMFLRVVCLYYDMIILEQHVLLLVWYCMRMGCSKVARNKVHFI
jgi:hypothetical protein